ncbi:GNAT family N-acetyltransferase [Aureivirga sp. CE67]|uniref:GNAT family N-acetyltransferase n=1 Tax=Aureivirga sp. CE67 TaxID=1788983 RepID=UPI0018C9E510|nr:GNAT family N-acetyltransferase [Aureivirga sp. CE67]
MNYNSKYDFHSKRLGFRNWIDSDIKKMVEINSDSEVMRFFPATVTFEQTQNFIQRMQKMYKERNYCYFAVDELETGNFIGFIGLCYQDYEAEFTPCTDIGWRLDKKYWNKGYATEGAKRCLEYAFDVLELEKIISTAPMINKPSIAVMEKIGMQKILEFKHSKLKDFPKIENCVCYEINRK